MVGLVLLIVPGIIFAVVFFYFGYAIVQQPELGVFDALKRSADITRGYRWPLFGLAILLVLINFVGLLACCVGLFFTYGITAVATAYSYKVAERSAGRTRLAAPRDRNAKRPPPPKRRGPLLSNR